MEVLGGLSDIHYVHFHCPTKVQLAVRCPGMGPETNDDFVAET